ncbi:phosphoglucomutase/phosphomannomutase alpha/beta/alpha domain I [Rhodomicrobium vannielii ATCC 17100]|uniref:Phosphoglucomutase/phosphomannomutase alpha/beta/alpha domain I n=1 Tax=Rhodomicrobium vannielii (strain ATCC 17100 / DSM 162 / LMG 4299 / NCIMB 10020 / ATH 3.1.1) TaxID=648757 RepID=E3I5H3_RHOVT|nr:phosphomannomutase [Rhodomicrobium vannielii]ADP71694.1 phosphoglucomutase/phosphomannomutase alpha/beta/alpha domain I [Rhodomicrobium vannielii ATCC 17100]
MTEKALFLVRALMEESGVAFGTSGARGLVSAMTDRVCYGYTTGFLNYLREIGEFAPTSEVALGGDLRPSTPRILRACAQAIRDACGVPVFCGHVPTPAIAHYAFARRIPSLMVTGSHIPDDRNGIKFHRASCEVLKTDEASIARQTVRLDHSRFTADGQLIDASPLPETLNIEDSYLQRYLEFFGDEALSGLTVGLYQHSAVGRDLLACILRALGAEAVPLGRSDRFIPVDTEALRPEDIDLARHWAGEHRLDAIVSTDGDSDRPLLADHRGKWLRGDILGLLCARELGAECVVTPVSSNTALEKSGAFPRTIRSRIGSPYVIAAMEAARENGGIVCGFEANGGFLLGSKIARDGRELAALPTRDAVLPIVSVLAAAKKLPVADLYADLPQRVTWSDRLKEFPTADSQAILTWLASGSEGERKERIEMHYHSLVGKLAHVDQTDGLRMTFESGAIIHLRASGNAPELRCYTETNTEESARHLNAAALKLVGDELIQTARASQQKYRDHIRG